MAFLQNKDTLNQYVGQPIQIQAHSYLRSVCVECCQRPKGHNCILYVHSIRNFLINCFDSWWKQHLQLRNFLPSNCYGPQDITQGARLRLLGENMFAQGRKR